MGCTHSLPIPVNGHEVDLSHFQLERVIGQVWRRGGAPPLSSHKRRQQMVHESWGIDFVLAGVVDTVAR